MQSVLYTAFDKDSAPVAGFVQWLADTHGLPQDLKVLDIGCGPGRMLSEYDRFGWRVTGMEPDPDFYQEALENIADIPGGRLYQGGFCELDFVSQFDLITAVNNPFSYLPDIPARANALERVYNALKPGGVFFMEITNFLYKLQHFEPSTVQNKDVNGETVVHVMENYVDLHEAKWVLFDQYILKESGDIIIKQHEQAVVLLPELLYLLQNQGFTSICTYNSYAARSCEPVTGKTILVSAQRPY